jgi:Secretion system C-terminal sorting domain
MNELNKENVEINTSHLSKGIYFVRIRFSNENNTQIMRKVVIE